jgi:hypothetical protein
MVEVVSRQAVPGSVLSPAVEWSASYRERLAKMTSQFAHESAEDLVPFLMPVDEFERQHCYSAAVQDADALPVDLVIDRTLLDGP